MKPNLTVILTLTYPAKPYYLTVRSEYMPLISMYALPYLYHMYHGSTIVQFIYHGSAIPYQVIWDCKVIFRTAIPRIAMFFPLSLMHMYTRVCFLK